VNGEQLLLCHRRLSEKMSKRVATYALLVGIILLLKMSAAAEQLLVPATDVGYKVLTPAAAWGAVNGSGWNLGAGQTTASFSAEFGRPYTVSACGVGMDCAGCAMHKRPPLSCQKCLTKYRVFTTKQRIKSNCR